ncbi:MAG: hypothetical protein KIS66_15485 [Fimbriimonadaceae bacterium]|nr:hypothetical protein [Fimbriimonadaceae bacterium]
MTTSPRIIVSTCGTSVLTNGTRSLDDERRARVESQLRRNANAPELSSDPDLRTYIADQERAVGAMDLGELSRASAEINGLAAIYERDPSRMAASADAHYLIATDTGIGREAARIVAACNSAASVRSGGFGPEGDSRQLGRRATTGKRRGTPGRRLPGPGRRDVLRGQGPGRALRMGTTALGTGPADSLPREGLAPLQRSGHLWTRLSSECRSTDRGAAPGPEPGDRRVGPSHGGAAGRAGVQPRFAPGSRGEAVPGVVRGVPRLGRRAEAVLPVRRQPGGPGARSSRRPPLNPQ